MRNAIPLVLLLALTPPAWSTQPQKPAGTLVDLSAEATQAAPNDLARATAYAEASGASPAEVAKRVNEAIAAGLRSVKSHPAVKAGSGNTVTYPRYGKNGRIEGWTMRSEIQLETRDLAALSELLGTLQASLAVGQIQLAPAPETRRRVEQATTIEAIGAFRAKAKLIADALGQPFRIRQLALGSAGMRPPMPMAMMRAKTADAAIEAAPIEAGESVITVSASGQIELLSEGDKP